MLFYIFVGWQPHRLSATVVMTFWTLKINLSGITPANLNRSEL